MIKLKVEIVKVGSLETNCYILTNKNNEVLIIDPGDEFNKIKENINGRKVVGMLITHEHFDHIGALEEVKKEYLCNINNFNIKDFNFEVVEVPGHRFDSKAFYFEEENIMFTGDFLFKGTFGRIDLPGGSAIDMLNSLRKIKKYPENIIIYPGHGNKTLLNYKEIDSYINYFL